MKHASHPNDRADLARVMTIYRQPEQGRKVIMGHEGYCLRCDDRSWLMGTGSYGAALEWVDEHNRSAHPSEPADIRLNAQKFNRATTRGLGGSIRVTLGKHANTEGV